MDTAWADADVVIERRIVNHRTAGAPIETRVCIADFRAGTLTLHLHQPEPAPDPLVHVRRARHLRGARSEIIAPDVGGGFGVKIMHYPGGVIARRRLAHARPPGEVDRDALGAHDLDVFTAATRSTT